MTEQQAPTQFSQQDAHSPRFQFPNGNDSGNCEPGDQCKEIIRIASELFEQGPDWVTFFREVLGLNGIIRQACPSAESLIAFEQTEQYQEILYMLAKLRGQNSAKPGATFEPTRVITVRLPKSLHESLRAEAHEKRTSMNKLCISKLLQVVDQELVPAEA